MSYSAPSGFTEKTIQTSRLFDDPGDPRVGPVAVDEPVEDPQRHLDAHVLVGVGPAVEQDLGLVLVDAHVVRDLDRPQLATLVALADREALDDIGVGRGDRRDVGRELGVGVEALPAPGELVGRGPDGTASPATRIARAMIAERASGRGPGAVGRPGSALIGCIDPWWPIRRSSATRSMVPSWDPAHGSPCPGRTRPRGRRAGHLGRRADRPDRRGSPRLRQPESEKSTRSGGRYWIRTSDLADVNRAL